MVLVACFHRVYAWSAYANTNYSCISGILLQIRGGQKFDSDKLGTVPEVLGHFEGMLHCERDGVWGKLLHNMWQSQVDLIMQLLGLATHDCYYVRL